MAAELKMLTQSENFTVNPDHTVVLPCVIQDQGTKKVRSNLLIKGSEVKVESPPPPPPPRRAKSISHVVPHHDKPVFFK